jgi:GNAT superfamily N-acetyltransferase
MKRVKVREFRPGDLGMVKLLIDETIEASYRNYPKEFLEYWIGDYHSEENILKDARNGLILVAVCDKKNVGTGTLVGSEIQRIFVCPQYQRKGIGKLVMKGLERQAKAQRIESVNLTSTATSKKFYDALGYSAMESRIFSIESGREIGYHRMTKRLQ